MISFITTGVSLTLKKPQRCMHCRGDEGCFIMSGPVARLVRDIRPVAQHGGSVVLCRYCRNNPGHPHKATSHAGLSRELIIQCACNGSALKYEFADDGYTISLLAGALFTHGDETLFYCNSCSEQFDSCPTDLIKEIRS